MSVDSIERNEMRKITQTLHENIKEFISNGVILAKDTNYNEFHRHKAKEMMKKLLDVDLELMEFD